MVVMKACLVVAGVVVVEMEAYSVVVYLVSVGASLPAAAAGEAFHEDACLAAVEEYLAGSYCVVAYPG